MTTHHDDPRRPSTAEEEATMALAEFWNEEPVPAWFAASRYEPKVGDRVRIRHHVYRAVSPSCPADLVVWRGDGRVLRIEVKTANVNYTTGHVSLQKAPRNIYEVICHVTADAVIYEPPIEDWA